MRSYTESQTLSINGNTISISGGGSVTLSQSAFSSDYNSLTNRPEINNMIAQALSDSGFLKTYTETQMLTLVGDTLYLTGGDSVVLPTGLLDISDYTLKGDTVQIILGTKTFTDTIIVPTRVDEHWNVLGNSEQAANYESMNYIVDSLRGVISDIKRSLYAPIVYTVSVDTTMYPMQIASGSVIYSCNAPLTARGFCYGFMPNPTLDDLHVTDTLYDSGNYEIHIGPVVSDTMYYVRAYATNEYGTNYGNSIVMRTPRKPTVETLTVDSYLGNMAIVSGNVKYSGNQTVTSRGLCWSTSANPTLSDSYLTSGTGLGRFQITITGLSTATTYYIRAFAINSVDTSYGENVIVTTLSEPNGIACPGIETVQDYDGNVYNTVKIGSQCWMKENLRSTTYNGTAITLITSATTSTTTKYRYYAKDYSHPDSVKKYGYLYNWSAVTGESSSASAPSGVQGICPTGWHLPSKAEYNEMLTFVETVYGMKDTVYSYINYYDIECCAADYGYDGYTVDDFEWDYDSEDWIYFYYVGPGAGQFTKDPNGSYSLRSYYLKALSDTSSVWTNCSEHTSIYCSCNESVILNNATNFTLRPAGYKATGSNHYGMGESCYFWASDNATSATYGVACRISSYSSSESIYTGNTNKYYCSSVRCVKDY